MTFQRRAVGHAVHYSPRGVPQGRLERHPMRSSTTTFATALLLSVLGVFAMISPAAAVDSEFVRATQTSISLNLRALAGDDGGGGGGDNISCTIGAWSAVPQKSFDAPPIVFVYGRDVAESDGACVSIDPLALVGYRAELTASFQYLIPGRDPNVASNWVEYDAQKCSRDSVAAQAAIEECTTIHSFFDKNDPIQGRTRRVYFKLETVRAGVRTLKSERWSLPITDVTKSLPSVYISDPAA